MTSLGKSRRRVKKGFTLTEVLAVVALLSIVAVIAVYRVVGMTERARIVAAEGDLRSIRTALTDGESGYLRDMSGIPGFSAGYLRLSNLLVSTNLYGETESAYGPEGRRVDDVWLGKGCAKPAAFTSWDESRARGWRGPYVNAKTVSFPSAADCDGDGRSFASRGFYPDLSNLRLPSDMTSGLNGCSVYGFPGEPVPVDPWGNPYVLQIPPPQAFGGSLAEGFTNATLRFRYARVVSAGPDGILDTPCFGANGTNEFATSWSPRVRRLSRQAGLTDGTDRSARGDDVVVFILRNDVDEGGDE